MSYYGVSVEGKSYVLRESEFSNFSKQITGKYTLHVALASETTMKKSKKHKEKRYLEWRIATNE